MQFSKGRYTISVEKIDGMGLRPGLWVGVDNQLVKVAVFGSDLKAEKFIEWLEYFFGVEPEPEEANAEKEIEF